MLPLVLAVAAGLSCWNLFGAPFENIKNWGITNKTTWDLSDDLTLKNIFGYRKQRRDQVQDLARRAAPVLRRTRLMRFGLSPIKNNNEDYIMTIASSNTSTGSKSQRPETREVCNASTGPGHSGAFGIRVVRRYAEELHRSQLLLQASMNTLPAHVAIVDPRGAIIAADTARVPAQQGFGFGHEDKVAFNRRQRMKNGQSWSHPGAMNPDIVGYAGPTDPQVSFISVQSTNGVPLALLANYSLHYVGGEGPGAVSADYYGMFADRVQELLKADRQDPPFVSMLSNGTSGVGPRRTARRTRCRRGPPRSTCR